VFTDAKHNGIAKLREQPPNYYHINFMVGRGLAAVTYLKSIA